MRVDWYSLCAAVYVVYDFTELEADIQGTRSDMLRHDLQMVQSFGPPHYRKELLYEGGII